ncbi:MAG TPA: serine/threonine-protein kinase [Bryobacteraceae bacterium]|nr:serine/threonine-protein kinase [Bryobacteraceae bacterium]
MTPERYSQVKSLFQLVLEQPPQQRAAFLERACGADRQLYTQVRELLQADSTSDDFLEKPAITPISKVLADVAADGHDPMPTQIGPYAIHKLLGSGGMGAVYLATRADKTYNKQVAVKVIHKGMETDRILQRFRRERQIVASLDHPNIARLLDGGATEDGRPYLVMEYVEGMAIDVWCDQRRLSTAQRLQLFLQVCDAIHYAHQNLIIHRDIKPGNILVRADGVVKLLDFGIAKLMNPDISPAAVTDKTATSMRLMTPQYASPEQVKGDPVTTASDVYLLGIVLYELLTGHRPYHVNNDATMEAVRAFSQGEPPKPSEAIFRTADRLLPDGSRQVVKNALTVSAHRDGSPAVLLKKLQGDLDAILLRALRRDPAHRYQSTAQLADDIRNHLNHWPISAIPDNPAYRARLFIRRNLAATLAATGALAIIVLIAVFAIWQATRARTERLRAEARFAEVRKLSDTLLFDVQDALGPLPGTMPARRLLATRAQEYLGNLAKESSGDEGLEREIANGYLRLGRLQGDPSTPNLGDSAGALSSYRRALTLLEPLHARKPKDASIANELAAAQEAIADAFAQHGDSGAALTALRKAVELRDLANAAPPAKASSYQNLAVALSAIGSNQEAQSYANKAKQLVQSLSGPDAPRQQAIQQSRMADVLQNGGELARAKDASAAALTLYEQLAAASPLAAAPKRELALALENLGEIESRMGEAASAGSHYQRALQLRRDLAAADSQNLQARRDLAYTLLKLGSTEDAVESFRQLAALDPSNVLARRDLARAWERQGDAQLQAGRGEAAVASYRNFLQTTREWIQRDPANPYANQQLAEAQIKLAESLPRAGDRDGAVQSARSAIQITEGLLEKDKEHPGFRRDRAAAQWALGRALADVAAANKQPTLWKQAEKELQRAKQLFDDIAARNQLTTADRQAMQAIANQIEACRQSGAL